MDLAAIRKEARYRLKDSAKPYFWSDEWLDSYINEAEQEACIRARLIEDDSSEATRLNVMIDEKRYTLHQSVLDVIACELESRPGIPFTAWTLNEHELILDELPATDDTLLLTVIRMPLSPMARDLDEPEIRQHHHRNLLDWVEYRAYLVRDADRFDPDGSARGYDRFEASFGERPDANVQRKHRRKTPRVVQMNHF